VVKVRGAGGGRVSIAGVACYRPGDRPHLFYQLRVYRRRKGEAKGFTWADYRDLILATHRALSAPLVYLGVRPGLRAGEELLLPVQLDGQDPTCWNQLSQSSI
jgi:hypothetical protein